ncbi:malectin domain-containing carbohydrate-binding protein, partial [Muricauda sp. 2012CJ35-5]
MEGYYFKRAQAGLLCLVFALTSNVLTAQSFTQNDLNFGGLGNVASGVTSLMYGPDGRLYVAEYPGTIKILTIQRNGPGNYSVIDIETLSGVKNITNYDDDGTPCSGGANNCSSRETTGLTVAGTASNPIIYVASSDFRIGAGPGGGNGDVDLDTNSGTITRFTWTGSTWEVVDIVRGLPRSEENHATNGVEFTNINGTDYLIVASGGHTNAGGPSVNFVYQCEYALSGAILSVNLDMIEGLPIQNNNGRSYIYDIPTLDDPTRPNANGITDPNGAGYNGIDVNDPFGGNDGLNQAVIVPSGPVQIYSPGYRNSYDIVLTESGALYATDNGANGGWGGFPENEGGGSATNNYVPSEPGSQSQSGNEQVDNVDHLQLITTNIQTYTPGSLYGGHPNPVRANPNGAGLFTEIGASQVFRTLTYDPNGSTAGSTSNANIALPANWPPVQFANPVEGDWRGPTVNNPDGPEDNPVATWGTNTNGIDEYTASNFNGAMQGDLLAGHSGGNVRRVQLQANGTLQSLNQTFLSGIGGNALGITCNSDSDIFPGTVWAGTLEGKIVVFEPQDFTNCLEPGDAGYSPTADGDLDGYLNQDEVDNGTQVCNGGSQPDDFDKSTGAPFISNLNDTDDDADGISDANDPFQLGNPNAIGSDAFTIPVFNDLFNSQQGLGGIFGLGMTGLMNNGDTGNNWLDWLDVKDAGPNPNDVLGGAPGIMTSHMTSGTALGTSNNQDKGYQYGVQVNNTTGVIRVTGGMNGFSGPLRLYGNTNGVTNGELGFFIGDGTQSNYIKFVVTTNGFTALQEINDVPGTPIQVNISVGDRPNAGILFHFVINPATGIVDLEYQIDAGSNVLLGTFNAAGSILQALQNANTDLAVGFIGTSNTSGKELEGSWDFLNVTTNTANSGVVARVNASGALVNGSDGVDWQSNLVNGATSGSGYSVNAGQIFGSNLQFANRHSSIPAEMDQSTFESLFAQERYDLPSAPEMEFIFPVSNGDYIVNIYAGNSFVGTSQVGQRVFDVNIEGQQLGDNVDLVALFGHQSGGMLSYATQVLDGQLNIQFAHQVENPLVNAIEILANSSNQNPIIVQPVANQNNIDGDVLDGSLGVIASGGDGNLSFSMSGQPPGVFIEPTNGQIGGTVNSGSANNSPYLVTILVDDSDAETVDAQTIQFTWIVSAEPINSNWVDKDENENYTGRHECSFVQAGNKFYLMGGRENTTTIDVYDYTTDSWTQLTNSAPQEFNHFQATEHQGLIWVIGAFKTNTFPTEAPADFVWAFDPTVNEWIQGPEIPASRKRGSAGLSMYNGKFYIVGGNTIGHNGGYVPWFDEYEPATGTWTSLSDAPRARDHFHSAVIGNKLYVSGGRLSGGPGGTFAPTIAEVDVYDFGTASWSTLPSAQNIPTQRAGHAAVNFNNRLVVMGGEVAGQIALKSTEEFDPVGQSWRTLSDMNFGRHGTQAIVSGGGIFVLAGSPNLGGGNQKNMEYLGTDNPQGAVLVASSLNTPSELNIAENSSANLSIDVVGGNTGIIIKSLEIIGPNASDFSIAAGALEYALLAPGANHQLNIAVGGTGTNKSATLVINYGNASSTSINISSGTPPENGVLSFTLMNSNDDTELFTITDGQQININSLPSTNLNVRANTVPSIVGSVSFQLSGTNSNSRTENGAPYALFGDNSGDYLIGSLPEGSYSLTATAYNGSNESGGVLGQPYNVNFSMVTGGVGNQPPMAVAT